MLGSLAAAVTVAVIAFIGYLLLKAYIPGRKATRQPMLDPVVQPAEAFQATPMPKPTKLNTPAAPVPAPAAPVMQDPPMEERQVAPGGPAAPNARAPVDTAPSISPEAAAYDPYMDSNMEAPIHDSMRHPELSFGPGVDNTGMNKLGLSGVGSARAMSAESPFSPEFAQNGGSFMDSVFANDLTKGDSFASA